MDYKIQKGGKFMNKELYKDILDAFETEEVRLYAEDMLHLAPAYGDIIAASSSGKYHNPQQCCEGGQLIHVKLACEIMNYILELEYVQHFIKSPKRRDFLRVAILLHDAFKRGIYNSDKTVHEHPILAANWIMKSTPTHDLKKADKYRVASYVATHSGQWRESKYSDVKLPKIRVTEQFLVHLCDYLASRKNIELTVQS